MFAFLLILSLVGTSFLMICVAMAKNVAVSPGSRILEDLEQMRAMTNGSRLQSG